MEISWRQSEGLDTGSQDRVDTGLCHYVKEVLKMQGLWLGIGLLIGLAMGALLFRWHHHKKLREIAEALDRHQDRERILNLKTLQEGDYSFLCEELRVLYDRTEYAVDALRKDRQQMKRYLEDISHQLKTPLAALITYLELLNREESGTREKEMLQNCMYLSERMEALIRSLLDLARFDAEEVTLKYQKCDILELLRSVVEDVSLSTFQEKLEFIFENDSKGKDIKIYADSYWLFHAMQNIIKNSVYYGGTPPKVTILVCEKRDMVEVRIRDNGRGFPEGQKNEIFQRFYRAGEGQRDGYGIGLALAKVIVERHGGNIFAVNDPGACFVIQLFRGAMAEKIS